MTAGDTISVEQQWSTEHKAESVSTGTKKMNRNWIGCIESPLHRIPISILTGWSDVTT